MRFDGDRRAVRMQSVAHALQGLLKRVQRDGRGLMPKAFFRRFRAHLPITRSSRRIAAVHFAAAVE